MRVVGVTLSDSVHYTRLEFSACGNLFVMFLSHGEAICYHQLPIILYPLSLWPHILPLRGMRLLIKPSRDSSALACIDFHLSLSTGGYFPHALLKYPSNFAYMIHTKNFVFALMRFERSSFLVFNIDIVNCLQFEGKQIK